MPSIISETFKRMDALRLLMALLLMGLQMKVALAQIRPGDSARIVGGQPIDLADVPPACQLLEYCRYICGGTILSKKHVITAGHCFVSRENIIDYMSIGYNQTKLTDLTLMMRSIKKVFIHPKFNRETLYGDIAVVEVWGQMLCVTEFAVVCNSYLKTNDVGLMYGWGLMTQNGRPSPRLNGANVSIISFEECSSRVRGVTKAENVMSRDGMYCSTGSPGHCRGDSGSGLVKTMYSKDYKKLICIFGIISWTIECGERGLPQGFSNIYAYKDFVSAVTRATLVA